MREILRLSGLFISQVVVYRQDFTEAVSHPAYLCMRALVIRNHPDNPLKAKLYKILNRHCRQLMSTAVD